MPNAFIDKYNHILGHKGFDYDQIDENIYIGTNMCCQLGFEKELLVKEVRADISLEDLRVDAPVGVNYFLWLPTVDRQAISPDKLALGVQTLEFLTKRKVNTYIHCKNGHGRAPTLYAAFLIKKGMTVDEAIKYIKSKRPEIHPSKVQIESLKEFKKSV